MPDTIYLKLFLNSQVEYSHNKTNITNIINRGIHCLYKIAFPAKNDKAYGLEILLFFTLDLDLEKL